LEVRTIFYFFYLASCLRVSFKREQNQTYFHFTGQGSVSIEREQCQACLDIVEREKHRSKTKRLMPMTAKYASAT